MTSSYLNVPAELRINERNAARNLETFLSFRFLPGSRLGLSHKNIYGTDVEVLKSTLRKSLSLSTYLINRFTHTYDLGRVAKYVFKQLPAWIKVLSNDDDKLASLERKLAILERVVIVYNKVNCESRKDFIKIDFKNPIKHILRVQIHYPRMLGEEGQTTVVRDILYDRLTSLEDLTALKLEALNEPVPVKFMGDKKLDSSDKKVISLNAAPSHIFKSVLSSPKEIANPAEESVGQKLQTIDVTYDLVDWSSLASLAYSQGQNEAMPSVYKQGYADGKKVGIYENLASITSEFNKAVTKK